jgi:protein tyrosine/serine phosphatase
VTVLNWPDLRNARDLGGLPAGNGRIKGRALVRTDNHDRLGAAGIAALDAYGVSRIVDLRWEWEAAKYRSPFAADPRYRLRPALDDGLADQAPTDSYGQLVDHSRTRLGAVVEAIAEAPPGAVVVHCHGGRDRTGVVIALVLRLAGVADAAIAADYARTPGALPDTVANTLTHIDAVHGGVEPYLLGGGVTRAHLMAVRRRLTG